MQKIVIVGGGAAGWMTASYLAKFNKDFEVTVVEAPGIPIIGVGESVTPHVDAFFHDLGIPRHEWMGATASVYKIGNKFINWRDGQGEAEYFGFTYSIAEDFYLKDVSKAKTVLDYRPRKFHSPIRNFEHLAEMYNNGDVPKYDRWILDSYHYMEKNKSFIRNGQPLLNEPWVITNHINAELTGNYLRDRAALPAGVKHVQGKVVNVKAAGDNITEIELEDGQVITADFFVDATGFHRRLIDKLDWEKHYYEDYPVDGAWVCQTDYKDQAKEMVNYTETIAEPYGWRFKLALYHRMGNGYVFSSKHISDEDALEYFKSQLKHKIRLGPKLIKWKPMRLKEFAKGNVISIGLSSGFIEPMEANAFYFIINGIRQLSDLLKRKATDWTPFNELMARTMDHTHDFLLLHYTLTQREDTPFWRELKARGIRENHVQLGLDKSRDVNNNVFKNLRGTNLFPDFMWLQMVTAWGHKTEQTLDPVMHELAKLTILFNEQKHDMVTDMMPNNFEWHKEHIFKGLSPGAWEDKFVRK
jgi:tryptophan halogenase